MGSTSWYAYLKKPSWAPPAWLFGPVWLMLYVIIFASFAVVYFNIFTGQLLPVLAIPFTLNLLFNFLFTPIQFGLKNNYLASIDILLVLITLIWALAGIFRYMPWVTFINIPYLLWVLFATLLQLSITIMNTDR